MLIKKTTGDTLTIIDEFIFVPYFIGVRPIPKILDNFLIRQPVISERRKGIKYKTVGRPIN